MARLLERSVTCLALLVLACSHFGLSHASRDVPRADDIDLHEASALHSQPKELRKREGDTSLGDDKRAFRFDLGKRDLYLDSDPQVDDLNEVFKRISGFRSDLGKRAGYSSFRNDLGKRYSGFRSDLGKRLTGFRADLGKRFSGFRSDLGKRYSGFRSDLGKRSRSDEDDFSDDYAASRKRYMSFKSDLGKRGDPLLDSVLKRFMFRSDLGKRAFRMDLGKKSSFRSDLGKRAFRMDLGKRSTDDEDEGRKEE